MRQKEFGKRQKEKERHAWGHTLYGQKATNQSEGFMDPSHD